MIEFTDRAEEILARSDAAARRFNPDARVRVVRAEGGVRSELADGPAAGDQVVERNGVTVFVEAGLDGTLDVADPHDRLILRPRGGTGPGDR